MVDFINLEGKVHYLPMITGIKKKHNDGDWHVDGINQHYSDYKQEQCWKNLLEISFLSFPAV